MTASSGGPGEGERDGRCEWASRICWACQQPIEGDTRRWRGEVVHPDCAAGLRCGITLEGRRER
jgi:hypothetical protein